MLALTRKKDEAIIIDGNIEIRVLDVQDGKVRLGVSAPKEMSIHREEIYLEIKANNQEATKGNTDTLKALSAFLKNK